MSLALTHHDHCSQKVFLLPSVLARKRIWNPKYPICIQLAEGANSQEGDVGISENLGGTETGSEHARKEKSFSEHVRDLPVTLYLFGRTGREKEEWFHHFLIAAKDTEMDKQHSGRCVSKSGMRTLSNCIREVLSYMNVWIMDYVLQFFAFQALTSVDSGPCRRTTAHFKLI